MIPRTGTTWARNAIHKAVKATWDRKIINAPGQKHNYEAPPAMYADRKFRFCFVRNVKTWLESRHRLGPWDDMLTQFYDWDLEQFKANIEARPKGLIGRYFKQYTRHCNFIGRQENLCEDLIRALTEAGEEFDADLIRSLAPENVGNVGPEMVSHLREVGSFAAG